jgi:hypothetical protein
MYIPNLFGNVFQFWITDNTNRLSSTCLNCNFKSCLMFFIESRRTFWDPWIVPSHIPAIKKTSKLSNTQHFHVFFHLFLLLPCKPSSIFFAIAFILQLFWFGFAFALFSFWSSSLAFFVVCYFFQLRRHGTSTGDFNSPLSLSKSLSSSWIFWNQS